MSDTISVLVAQEEPDEEHEQLALSAEGLLAIYQGRDTYDDNEQWLAEVDGAMGRLAREMGIAFQSQIGGESCSRL